MAIITIPTSIGGINIPGGVFGGPLSDLEGSEGHFFYQYPRDLESATRAHSVIFQIEEINEVELKVIEDTINNTIQRGADLLKGTTTDDAAAFVESAGNSISDLGSKALDSIKSGIADITNNGLSSEQVIQGGADILKSGVSLGFKGLSYGVNYYEAGGEWLTQQTTTPVGQIGLYMPEEFNVSASISYDDSISVSSAMGSVPLLGDLVKSATNFAEGAGNDAFKLLLNKAGYVFNPQKQVLFQGIEFRNFNMSFTFIPYSAAEAEQVKKIIEKFRMYSAPKKNTQLGKNSFWVPPAQFDIKFKFGGQENPNLPKLKKCVIKSIDVNYAPNGWTTHTDGAPVQTNLTLEFQEIALVGRDDISEGY